MNLVADTKEKLLQCGKYEFLEKGFKEASLRNIAKAAGLTTGAIYGYFKDKNALFEALVAPVSKRAHNFFDEISKRYFTDDGFARAMTPENGADELSMIFRFVYDNFDAFRLLVVRSEGSSYADFVHGLVMHETKINEAYLAALSKTLAKPVYIDPQTMHILTDSYINALMEPIRHNMTYGEAMKHVAFLGRFYAGGWDTVIKDITDSV